MTRKSALFIFFSILIAATSLFAQKNAGQSQKRLAGITFSSFGNTEVLRFKQLEGAASYNPDKFFTVGINYLYSLNKTVEIETGVEYSKHRIYIKPNLPPDMDNTPYSALFYLINIPFTLRVNFLKYCFVNGGLNLDIDPAISSPIDNQNGIGGIIGLGIKYDSDSGFSAFINPYFKAHSLIPFSAVAYQQRVMESGLRIGVFYKL